MRAALARKIVGIERVHEARWMASPAGLCPKAWTRRFIVAAPVHMDLLNRVHEYEKTDCPALAALPDCSVLSEARRFFQVLCPRTRFLSERTRVVIPSEGEMEAGALLFAMIIATGNYEKRFNDPYPDPFERWTPARSRRLRPPSNNPERERDPDLLQWVKEQPWMPALYARMAELFGEGVSS